MFHGRTPLRGRHVATLGLLACAMMLGVAGTGCAPGSSAPETPRSDRARAMIDALADALEAGDIPRAQTLISRNSTGYGEILPFVPREAQLDLAAALRASTYVEESADVVMFESVVASDPEPLIFLVRFTEGEEGVAF